MLYNEAQYNEQPYQFFLLGETVTFSDVVTKDSGKNVSDVVFLSDELTRQVTQKILSETLTPLDWLSQKQKTPNWGD